MIDPYAETRLQDMLHACANGDERARNDLFMAILPLIDAKSIKFAGFHYQHQWEDLKQAVKLRVMEGLPRYGQNYAPAMGSVAAFLGGCVHHEILRVDRAQRAKKRSTRHLEWKEEIHLPPFFQSKTPEAALKTSNFSKHLDRFLGNLSGENRQLFIQMSLFGQSARELSQDLNLSESSIYQRHRRIKAKLATYIEGYA